MFNKFEFSGFKPQKDLALYADGMLFKLGDCLEDQFISLGTVAKIGSKYFCLMEVLMPTKAFLEESSAEHPKTALENTHRRMRERIAQYNTEQSSIANAGFWEQAEIG